MVGALIHIASRRCATAPSCASFSGTNLLAARRTVSSRVIHETRSQRDVRPSVRTGSIDGVNERGNLERRALRVHDRSHTLNESTRAQEALGRRTPGIVTLLAAQFNDDWELDHADVEAAYADAFDGLTADARNDWAEQAKVLQKELSDDHAVQEYLRYVGTGLSPGRNLGLSPKRWLDTLVERLERT